MLINSSQLKRNWDWYLLQCRMNGAFISTPLCFSSSFNILFACLPPYHCPFFPCLSSYDMSKRSCRHVNPDPRLIGARRSNQGRTNQTVLVISRDQCSLGSWEMCAYICHRAWACIVTWADLWLNWVWTQRLAQYKTDLVWSHLPLLKHKAKISLTCDTMHRD